MPSEVVLSRAQQQVVEHRGSDLQVIACAGSGKTESIARRIASLIKKGEDPATIVAFTFTERAAAELKDRILRRVSDEMGMAFRDRLGPMFVGTIHSYCLRLLQDHVPEFGNFDVLDENRLAGLLSREHKRLELSKLGNQHWRVGGLDVSDQLDRAACGAVHQLVEAPQHRGRLHGRRELGQHR
jgi:DNA helicase-2/ATP-dependent DNA helicase PcrA